MITGEIDSASEVRTLGSGRMTTKFTMDTFLSLAADEGENELEAALDTDGSEHGIVIFIRGDVQPDDGEFSHLTIGNKTFDLDCFEDIKGCTNRRLSIAEAERLRDALDTAIGKAKAAS